METIMLCFLIIFGVFGWILCDILWDIRCELIKMNGKRG